MGLRTYINGTLYSLLTRPRLREEAQALGLEEMLKTLDLAGDEDFARQIRYIQQQLHSSALDNAESDANEDDDDEEDDEDEEVDEEEESLEPTEDGLAGEQLLCSSYLATGAAANVPRALTKPHAVKSPGHNSALTRTMPRPSTPGLVQPGVPSTPFNTQLKLPATAEDGEESPKGSPSMLLSGCRAPMPDEETLVKVKAKMDGADGEQDMNAEFVTAFEMRSKIVRTPPC
eukprot:TRINITY_DN5731_c0_g1_i3.p1 TRINITY_DN5731_c0_g1~~TRINITY_DN5731_c0_g1_i3.p1  ORF type:complete len:231 (+),score=61.30 TRINITY_DN5731_c0_g1_i3:840-1532(+)